MILLFPNHDTLLLSLAKDLVPRDVTLAPAAVTFDKEGRIYVEPTVALSKAVAKTLDRLGVKGSKRHATDAPEDVASWLQILPVTKEAGTPALSSQTAVLFELGSADDLPTLVTEMLRLGNDRQGFRWFAAPGDAEAKRVLLRVVGPPYYTLLRALDKTTAGVAGGVRAYLERAPRVWVEIGHTHPFAGQIRVADGQLLLVRAPREWLFLDETPFQDVYDVTQFQLPASAVGWTEATAPKKMTVPLRLTAGNAADVPELWVLRADGVEQLDALVRDADDRLTQRLMFAVASTPDGQRTVVLRTRPSKLAPPVLPLEHALGFKPYWKLPNLFLPAGKRLHPTLRRDAVRRLLAADPDQVVWLHPDGPGGFTPESVPDAAFRALEDWVDYVIEADQKPLAAWIEATRFDFDHFLCTDSGGPRPKPDRGDKEPKNEDDARSPKAATPTAKPGAKGKPAAKPTAPADVLPPPPEVKPPSEWKLRREELEKQFLAIDGALDAPERQALWPELARANAGLRDAQEAAVCWLNALWDADPMPAEWVAGWVRSELPDGDGTVRADEFDRRLYGKTPSVTDARALVASFLGVAQQHPAPPWLATRLPAIQKYIETNEGSLPVRAVWLAAYRLSQLAGKDSDVLGLARVRDRLLQRLLDQGLSAERDLPVFLRYAGLKDSERLRLVKEKATELHQVVLKWTDHFKQNVPYVNLMFAFAFAKLNESTQARKLLEDAREVMEKPVTPAPEFSNLDETIHAIASNFLYREFRYRIERVMRGKPHTGQPSSELSEELDEIVRRSKIASFGLKGPAGQSNNPYWRAEYIIGRMREQSRILEPEPPLHPYEATTHSNDPLKQQLTELHRLRDPAQTAARIRQLYRTGVPGKSIADVHLDLLHTALPLAARVGETFAVELLALVPAALAAGPKTGGNIPEPVDLPRTQGELLERSMAIAAHFDRGELLQQLVSRFSELLHTKSEESRFKLINVVAGQCLRTLRKFGLRDEIDRFLGRLQSEVLQGKSLPALREKYAAKPEMWGTVLQTLLNLAAGWLTFGLHENADPILNEARNELLNPNGLKLSALNYTRLARAYVAALSQGPSEAGLPRITALFREMEPGKITNTWTTAPYYSRLHLNLVEDVILAIVSDEFALGPAGRRWLDDDEFLVRRRIHADMRRYLQQSGLLREGSGRFAG